MYRIIDSNYPRDRNNSLIKIYVNIELGEVPLKRIEYVHAAAFLKCKRRGTFTYLFFYKFT